MYNKTNKKNTQMKLQTNTMRTSTTDAGSRSRMMLTVLGNNNKKGHGFAMMLMKIKRDRGQNNKSTKQFVH